MFEKPSGISSRHFVHGLSHTRIDNIYRSMKERCYNENHQAYRVYGERGITICDEWLNDKKEFFKWAYENGYNDDLSIDRIDNDLGYYPTNCRWVTMKVQQNNKSNNRVVSAFGKEKTLHQWADEYGIKNSTLWARLNRGWDIERALTEKVVPRVKGVRGAGC